MKKTAIAVLAVVLFAISNAANAQSNGRVVINNKSDQLVHIHIDYLALNGGELESLGIWYTFEPYKSSRLNYGDAPLNASNVGYRLTTAAGTTPERGRIWETGERAEKGTLEIVITDAKLAKRQEGRKLVRAAWAVIESQTTAIMGTAHPTATNLQGFYESTWDVTRGGKTLPGQFGLTYKYTWKSGLFDDDNWTRIYFFFDEGGKIYQVSGGKTSSLFPPFAASDLIVEFFEDEILNSKEIKEDKVFEHLIRQAAAKNDARSMLALWLRFKQG